MSISADCSVQDGASSPVSPYNGGVNVTPTDTITIQLLSSSGVDLWELFVAGTDELISPPTITINHTTKSATFAAPAAGSAVLLTSRVTSFNGIDPSTKRSPYIVARNIGIYTLTNALRVGAVGETFEGDPTHGWTSKTNAGIRAAATGGGGGGGGAPTFIAHGAITQYAAVCSYSAGHLQQATPALLIAGAVLVGIAPAAVTDGSTFTPTTIGQTITVSGLSGGTKGSVGINGLGGLVKTDPGGWEMGTVNASDTLTITPKTPLSKAPTTAVNPLVWGVIPNDWNSCLANDAALHAMYLAISAPGDTNQGIEIFFDQPIYLSEPWEHFREINLRSTGGTVNAKARIITPTSRSGLIAQSYAFSSDGGDATRATFDAISCTQCVPPIVGDRPNGGAVTAGKFYTIPGESRYYVLCTVSGTTGSSLPTTMTPGNGAYAPLPRLLITSGDNGVQWKFYGYAGKYVKVRQSSTAYAIGDMTRPFGDSRFDMVATTSGTTAATEAVGYSHTSEGALVTDGGVTWRSDVYAGFNNRAALTRYTNCGVGGQFSLVFFAYGQSGSNTNCNNIQVTGLQGFQDNNGIPAGGVYIGGTDANGCQVSGCSMLALGFGHDGYCGFGYWDHSEGANKWSALYTEAGTGPGYVSDGITGTHWDSCHSENYSYSRAHPNDRIDNCNFNLVPGAVGGILLHSVDPTLNHGVSGNDYTSVPNVHTTLEINAGSRAVYAFRSDDEINSFSWQYGVNGVSTNYWNFGLTPSGRSAAFSISGGRAVSGANNLWIRNGGWFAGESTKRFFGADSAYKLDKNTNAYQRNLLDTWPSASVGRPGDFLWDTPTTSGLDAPAWTHQAYTAGTIFGYLAVSIADCVNDGAGRVFRCTRDGTATGTTPTWSSVTTVDASPGRVYQASSRWALTEIVRPNTANTHKYSIKPQLNATASAITPPTAAVPGFTSWLPSTRYYANSIISQNDGLGDTFFCFYVQPYTALNTFIVGDIVTPTVAKYGTSQMNRVFRCIAYTNGSGTVLSTLLGGAYAITGASEPTWPTDGVSTVENGSCLFQEVAMMSGATEPSWNTKRPSSNPLSNGVTVDGPGLDLKITWRTFGLWSCGTEPTWASAGADTADNPSAKTVTDAGFGITWTSVGTDNAASRLTDSGGVDWTLVGTTPVYSQSGKIINQGAVALSSNGTVALTRYQAFYELISATTTSLDFGAGGPTGAHQSGSHHSILNAGSSEIAVAPGPSGVANTIIPPKTLYTFTSDGTSLYQNNPSASPVYRPSSKAGLKFWSRPDLLATLNGSKVSSLVDLSGSGRSLSQGATGKQFVWNATGINGKPTLTGLAANTTCLYGPSTDPVTVALTAFCVIKCTTLATNDQPFGKAYSVTEWCFAGAGAGKIEFGVGGAHYAVSNVAVNDGNPHVLIAVWDQSVSSGIITLYVDGVAQTTTALFAGTISGGDSIAIGAADSGATSTSYFSGEIGECGIFNSALSGSDLTNLTAYLKAFWGVP